MSLSKGIKIPLSHRMDQIKGSGIRKAFELAARLKDVIHLGLGEPDFDPPSKLKEYLKKSVDEGFSHYTLNSGLDELRSLLAEYLKREHNLNYDPSSEIMVTVGGMNGIHLALMSIVNLEDEVIIQDPSFVGFEPAIIMAGGRAVHVPLYEENSFRIQAEDIEKHITDKTRGIILNTPHNPTGAVLSKQDLEDISQVIKKHNLFVISDEAYERLVFDGKHHISIASLPDMKDRTIVVMSFSKTFAICGWRIGFVAAPSHIIQSMIKLQQFDSVHPAAPIQKAICHLLRERKLPTEISAMLEEFQKRRDFMVKGLNSIDGISCVKPEGAFYLFVNIKKLNVTSSYFSDFLLKQYHIVTVPGDVFGKYGEGYIRICLTVPVEKLKVALERIKEAVKQIKNKQKP